MSKRKGASDITETDKKKRNTRRWSNEETMAILEYMKETIKKGLTIEKPTAITYFKRLIAHSKLQEVTPQVVRDKVRNLRLKYAEAVKWSNETGQGIKEQDGYTRFEEALKCRYPFFDESQEIWGSKASINVPYISTTEQIGPPVPDRTDENLILEFENDENIDMSQRYEIVIDPLPVETETIIVPRPSPPNSLLKKSTKTSKSCYEENVYLRETNDAKKLELKKDQLQLEREKFEFQNGLEKSKFDMEFQLRKEELQIRKEEMQSNREIRLMELEVEKLKWQAELAKIQSK